ncbi:hypothetical protein [Klebsiella variicola]|uniref:hypothetical protein n=1 Tax=Klebsiella variicola TaxID=244366 RepID=UPI00190D3487|nr:hypothetical protein [Klebsiella variicola]
MTKSTITRERLEKIASGNAWVCVQDDEAAELARMALAAMDSEPVKRVNADQMHHVCLEANRHLDKYGAMAKEVNKLLGRIPAQPVPELKPVGYLFVSDQGAIAYSPANWGMPGFRLIGQIYGDIDVESQPAPVVPDDVLDALQKVARIRLDLNEFDGDRRGIADCLCDAEEALIEVVNRRAAMLNGGKP